MNGDDSARPLKREALSVERCPVCGGPALTDDERMAIQWIVGDALSVDGVSIQETLRGLLERTAE